METYYMLVSRVDRSKYHAATVQADSIERARELFKPDYGFGILVLTQIPASHINPSAELIIDN